MINFFLYSTSCATYSRNKENGGLVTTISASSSSLMHSSLRKSPSPFRAVAMLASFFKSHFTSAIPTAPSALVSVTSLSSILNGSLPFGFKPLTSKSGNCPPAIGDFVKLVVINFLRSSALKLVAKYLKKLLSNGSSQLQYTTLPRNCS